MNNARTTIVGVLPPGFRFPEDTELWLPAGWNGLPRDRRGGNWLSVLARLRPGVTLAQAQAEMNTIQTRLAQQYSRAEMAPEAAVVPLLQQTVGRNTRTALLVLWGLVGRRGWRAVDRVRECCQPDARARRG